MKTIEEFKKLEVKDQKVYLCDYNRLFTTCDMTVDDVHNSSTKGELTNMYRVVRRAHQSGVNVRSRTSSTSNAFAKDRARKYKDEQIPDKAFQEKAKCLNNTHDEYCAYCNACKAESRDHIICTQGCNVYGKDNELNIIPSCHRCNSTLKQNMPIHDWVKVCNKNWPKVWPARKCSKFLKFVDNYKDYLYMPQDEIDYINKSKANLIMPLHDLIIECHQENLVATSDTLEMIQQLKGTMVLKG
tara:strand:- start:451 stop:1179 length:729 start_codon:yes stop_codon:yes gene_type:complete